MNTAHHHRFQVRPALAPGRAWRGWTAGLLTAVASLSGCYTHRPLTGVPPAGATVVVDLNDRGRLVLGDSIGPSASQIQGVVATSRDSSYVLRVESVRYLSGQTNRWTGEPLGLRTDLVGRVRQREYSRQRTWALGGAVVAAIAAVVLTTDLLGDGGLGRSREPGPPIGTQ